MNIHHLQDERTTNQGLEPILMRALKRFRSLLPGQIEITLEMSHEEPHVRANAEQLEDALLSACMVAWQSMGGKARQIVIEFKEVLLDKIVLDADAEKLGGGLPPRLYAWLHISNSDRTTPSPFSTLVPAPDRVDDQPASARRLKLLEIRNIFSQHNGWMTVLPEPGKGTAFEIFLPTAMPLEIPVTKSNGTEIKHIMYVDDYDAMRDLVGETLPDAGFQVTCFESGEAALQAVIANPFKFDAVVSDYKMHGYCGIDLLREIKKISTHLPVVIISGYVDDALQALAIGTGAAAVITKTSDLSELCVELRTLLGSDPDPALVNFSEWARL